MSLPQNVAKVMPWPVVVTYSLPSTFHICFVLRDYSKVTRNKHITPVFIFCRRVSLIAVAILPVIASTTWLFTLVFGKVTGDKSGKRFCETWFSTTCHSPFNMSLVAPVTLWDMPLVVMKVQLYTACIHCMISEVRSAISSTPPHVC